MASEGGGRAKRGPPDLLRKTEMNAVVLHPVVMLWTVACLTSCVLSLDSEDAEGVTGEPTESERQALVVDLNDPSAAASQLFAHDDDDATYIERGGEEASCRRLFVIHVDQHRIRAGAWRVVARRTERGQLSSLVVNLAPGDARRIAGQVRSLFKQLEVESDLPE